MNFLKWGGKEAACKAAEKLVEDVGSSVIALLTYDAAAQHTKTVATKVLAAAEGDSTAKSPQVGTNTDANNSSTPPDTVPSADSSGRVHPQKLNQPTLPKLQRKGGHAQSSKQRSRNIWWKRDACSLGTWIRCPLRQMFCRRAAGSHAACPCSFSAPASEAAASPPSRRGVAPPPPATLTLQWQRH